MPVSVIIPARFASSRFPGKPLHVLAGKPMLQHVWERCRGCRNVERVVIATDDERIAALGRRIGAEVVMTGGQHVSGTDRVAEAAACLPGDHEVINVQGDEPLVSPALIDEMAEFLLTGDPSVGMVTAVHALRDEGQRADPNVVKCVLTRQGRALYFSRCGIPYERGSHAEVPVWRHMGIYGYRRAFLEAFVRWPASPLELAESLEQLRALENGAAIQCLITEHESPGIDTLEQAVALEPVLAALLEKG